MISGPAVGQEPDLAQAQRLLEQGRQALRAGQRYAALAAFAQARRLQPGDAEIARALGDLLMDLGAPGASAEALGPAADLGVQSRLAAQRLRWAAEIAPRSPDPSRRFELVDPALAGIDALLAQARAATPPDPGLLLRLQRDRAVALRQRERWTELLEQVEQLRAQGDEPPPAYVREAQARALLALRRPQEARAIFDALLRAQAPSVDSQQWRELMQGRIQAAVDAEDYEAAFADAEALIAAAPRPIAAQRPKQSPRPVQPWLDARVLAAQLRSWAEMPAEAWARIEPLQQGAPALPWLRAAAADIEAQRGWARRAEADIEIARAMAPDDFGIRLAEVDSDLRRHRLARAEQRFAPLAVQGAGLPAVERMRRELDAQSGPDIAITLMGSREEGQALRAPGDGGTAELRVRSALQQGLWRLVGVARHEKAEIDGSDVLRNRGGAGLELRWPDVNLQALAWSQRGTLDTGAASLGAAWEVDDHWRLYGDAEYHTSDIALRADAIGVTGDLLRLRTMYAWHESRTAELQIEQGRYSDGNRRRGLVLQVTQKLLDRPRLELNLQPRLDWQSNSRPDAYYFNPEEALRASLAAELRHVTWRAYERVFIQRASLTAGAYAQRGFGTRSVGELLYEHAWRRDPWTELVYGLVYASNVYDGQRENAWRAYLNLRHRFGR